jgi:ribosomal protein S18 acetylase RimI-like enzyme
VYQYRDSDLMSAEQEHNVKIRLATAADAEAIALVLSRAFCEYESSYTPEAFAATILTPHEIKERMNDGPAWVALENGVIVGTVSLVLKNEEVYIRSMAVSPSARGKGIGRKLLDRTEAFAISNRCKRLFLSTTPFLSRAINLYERFGFRRNHEGPANLFGTPLFTMSKSLEALGAAQN